MACTRGCAGTPICSALDLCCIQLRHDCGKECAGVADGFSTIQINAAGNLEICSNVGGVCTCTEIVSGTTSTVIDNGDGTWDHNDGDGNTVVLDVCQLIDDGGCSDTLVNNADGTFTHTDLQGIIVTLDVCALIADGICSDTLVDNADGTITHTDLQGIIVTFDICDMLIDGNCTFNETALIRTATTPVAVAPAGTIPTVLTNVEPPAFAAITNTSDGPCLCTVTMGGIDMNAANFGIGTPEVGIASQLSTDGGATWLGGTSQQVSTVFGPGGDDQSFQEWNVDSLTSVVTLAAGATLNFGVRRQYVNPDGTFAGFATVSSQDVTATCVGFPA